MIYKNYMISYFINVENIIIAEMDENIPKDASGEWILAHTKRLFEIPGNEIEHCREHLDNNGLYLGIFPPEFIEQGISEEIEFQKKAVQKTKENFKNTCKRIWCDEDFKELADGKNTLNDILNMLNYINTTRVNIYRLEPIDIQKEYSYYLNKYWGDERSLRNDL